MPSSRFVFVFSFFSFIMLKNSKLMPTNQDSKKMTASRAGSPTLLHSPLCAKCARLTESGLMSSAELESVEFLADIASTALQLDLH